MYVSGRSRNIALVFFRLEKECHDGDLCPSQPRRERNSISGRLSMVFPIEMRSANLMVGWKRAFSAQWRTAVRMKIAVGRLSQKVPSSAA